MSSEFVVPVNTFGMFVGAVYLGMSMFLLYSERYHVPLIFPFMFLGGGVSIVLISNRAITVGVVEFSIQSIFLTLGGYIFALFVAVAGFIWLIRYSPLCTEVDTADAEPWLREP